jgi:acyl carrier protein/thioesterase domain-containing protein
MLRERLPNHMLPSAVVIVDELPRLPSLKIDRVRIAEIDAGRNAAVAPHDLDRPTGPSTGRLLTDMERWLTELWKRVLGLEFPPSLEDSFLELGGDSLASSELIFAVEEKFSCELAIESFFRQPTIATVCRLIEKHAAASQSKSPARSADGRHRLLHKLQSYMGTWPGERLFAESLVVGLNCAGRRTPIFWICQEREELQQLAKHLGPDQPLYGMRSCVGIVDVKDYSTDVIETVCNRFLWEVLALPVKAPFFVGGVCQAGILALALAKRLKQIGRAPALLMLIEWTYSYGRYTEPTLLLYGDRSFTAEIYRNPGIRGPNWRDDFPERSVAAISGEHGNLFVDENITGLAELITRHVVAGR